MEKDREVLLELGIPTAFPDYNKAHGLSEEHETKTLKVQRMKHKHFRKMQSMPEAKQIHYIMGELTGLSQNDIDELDAEDSAALSEVIFSFMKKYADIAKQMGGREV